MGISILILPSSSQASWRIPVNLGTVVNTECDETAPSISPSGDTLYFSSDRPGGEGGFGIWMSVMENGEWGTPVNLGAGVNSSSNASSSSERPKGSTIVQAL